MVKAQYEVLNYFKEKVKNEEFGSFQDQSLSSFEVENLLKTEKLNPHVVSIIKSSNAGPIYMIKNNGQPILTAVGEEEFNGFINGLNSKEDRESTESSSWGFSAEVSIGPQKSDNRGLIGLVIGVLGLFAGFIYVAVGNGWNWEKLLENIVKFFS